VKFKKFCLLYAKPILLPFFDLLSYRMEARFPEDKLMDWKVFDQAAISSTTDFEFGNDSIGKLVIKYAGFIPTQEDENVTETTVSVT